MQQPNHKTKGTATIKPNTTCLFSQNSMSEVTRSGGKLACFMLTFLIHSSKTFIIKYKYVLLMIQESRCLKFCNLEYLSYTET